MSILSVLAKSQGLIRVCYIYGEIISIHTAITWYFFCTATGKSTFLNIVADYNPSYQVIQEPLSRWTNVPSEDHVSYENTIYLICP